MTELTAREQELIGFYQEYGDRVITVMPGEVEIVRSLISKGLLAEVTGEAEDVLYVRNDW